MVLQPRVRITRQYGSYVAGSAAEHCAAQIDSRIAGKTDANLPMFSHVDHANGQYKWSTAADDSITRCWAHDINLTCFPVWNSGYLVSGVIQLRGPYQSGCLVTPRILLVACHFSPDEGETLRFVSKEIDPATMMNRAYEATVLKFVPLVDNYNKDAEASDIHSFDLGFVVLDHALDASIHPAKILGSVARLGVEDPAFGSASDIVHWGVPCLGVNQSLEAFVQDAAYQQDYGLKN